MTPQRIITVRVPGKVMLCGEYTILRGGRAIASAVGRYLDVTLQIDADAQGWEVHSELWRQPKKVEPNLKGDDSYAESVLLDAVHHAALAYPNVPGGTISVLSGLRVQDGLGSSSAIRLGVFEAFRRYSYPDHHAADDCWSSAVKGYNLQKKRQGVASGYDFATQLLGGCISIRPVDDQAWPGQIETAENAAADLADWVIPLVGGAGAPTGAVMTRTIEWLERTQKWSLLHDANESLCAKLWQWIEEKDRPISSPKFKELIGAVAYHRSLFAESPDYPTDLFAELEAVDGFDSDWSAKPTGAGGEDAILLFGDPERLERVIPYLKTIGWSQLDAGFTQRGLTTETTS